MCCSSNEKKYKTNLHPSQTAACFVYDFYQFIAVIPETLQGIWRNSGNSLAY